MASTFRRVAVLAIAASVFAIAGCAGTDAPAPAPAATLDPNEEITLDFSWWGNDDRATRYNEAIALFQEEHPNITINGSFTDFQSYWEKRQVEAAGGGLPDVMQFDWSYLTQYAQNSLLLDLAPYFGGLIDSDVIDPAILAAGDIDGKTLAIPTGAGPWALYQNMDLLNSIDVESYPGGGSWQDYSDWMGEVTDAAGGAFFGGTDYTQRIQNFELQLRAAGGALFTDDGELGFDEDQLREFWESGDVVRDGVVVPQQSLEEIFPRSGFGAALTASEMSWISFLAGYYADSGAEEIIMVAPPTADPSVKDLYPKVGLMQAVSAETEHPEAAAAFVDFLINSPEVAKIFGATLGLTGSSTAAEGADLQGPDLQVKEYVESVADRMGDPPAAPVVGYGTIEQTFWDLGKEIGLGTLSVDDAVSRFFQEADVVLQG